MSKKLKEIEEDSEDETESEEEAEDISIADDDARGKNQMAAKFVDQAMEAVIKECIPGKLIVDLCQLGDKVLTDLTSGVFNKAKGENKIEKGIAFPTCVSVNNVVCHYSPLKDDTTTLKEGDVVRIDLGAHIDGHISQAAHTVVVQSVPGPVTGKVADLIVAAQHCIDAALRLMRPGNKNNDIPPVWAKIAEQFDVNICEGVLSHRLKRFVLDGNETIISKIHIEQKVEDYEFAECEVWAVDLVLSSGPGKLKQHDARPLIYRRAPDQQYLLKLKASRDVMKEVTTKYPSFPFALRAVDIKSAAIGMSDCLKHDLVMAYPVLSVKPGDVCVHFKTTVFITQNMTKRVNNFLSQQQQVVTSEKKLTEESVLKLLEVPLVWGKVYEKKEGSAAKSSPRKPPTTTTATTSTAGCSSSTTSTSTSNSGKGGKSAARGAAKGSKKSKADVEDEWEDVDEGKEEEEEKKKRNRHSKKKSAPAASPDKE